MVRVKMWVVGGTACMQLLQEKQRRREQARRLRLGAAGCLVDEEGAMAVVAALHLRLLVPACLTFQTCT